MTDTRMTGIARRQSHPERPELLYTLSALGFAGCLSLVIGVIVAQIMVPNHNHLADTISDLAAGPGEIYMDVALYGFASGLFALALAISHAHLGRALWSAGAISFAALAAIVVVIAARNEYGDGDSEGVEIHIYLVYALGVLFLVAPLLLAPGLGRDHARERRWVVGLALLWGVMAPVFFVLPDDIDGAYEIGIGVIACANTALISWIFWQRARSARGETDGSLRPNGSADRPTRTQRDPAAGAVRG